MSAHDFDPADEEAPVRRIQPPIAPNRELPSSPEAEQHVIAVCALDPETLTRAIGEGITPASFLQPPLQAMFARLLAMRASGMPTSVETLTLELLAHKEVERVGGMGEVMHITGAAQTTAHAGYMIAKVREKQVLREAIKAATGITERAYAFTGGIEDFTANATAALSSALTGSEPAPQQPQRLPSSFSIPPITDPSVLLGNRYLNRGDGIILSGPSGMGKSSIQTQAAVMWALGRPFQGINPNGPLKSLIIQSEDSDGDIAEVLLSIYHALGLTPADRELLDTRIRIVTDRVNRGSRFIQALRRHALTFAPDLIWLNPLQAFIDGDVTESRDLGAFLREGLNGANADCKFGYVIIHHTTKPATGRDKGERLWHEVMYDMAGGAELINWARAIISLRPGDKEGEFKLVLAKRGRRAGVTRQVEQGAGFHLEPVTTLGLRHSTDKLPSGLPVIFWETMDHVPKETVAGSAGRKPKYDPQDFEPIWPKGPQRAIGFRALHRFAKEIKPNIGSSAFESIILDAMDAGILRIDKSNPKQPRYYAAETRAPEF